MRPTNICTILVGLPNCHKFVKTYLCKNLTKMSNFVKSCLVGYVGTMVKASG
jgi:hypothetical protein